MSANHWQLPTALSRTEGTSAACPPDSPTTPVTRCPGTLETPGRRTHH
jgi:hypothetical protein